MQRKSTILAAALAMVMAAGCASAGAGGSAGHDRNLITRAEIEDANQTTALDLIRSLRPGWLRTRGTPSITQQPVLMVYVDQMRAGTASVLRSIQTLEIAEIRYYGAADAQARFGVGHVQGVIQVITRRR